MLPGVGAVIASLASAGAIWSMYYRICEALGISISENILKALGSAVVSNIVTQLGGILVASLVSSFIPGLALATTAAVCYGVTYLAGVLFIEILVDVLGAGGDPAKMTEDQLADAARKAARKTDCKDIFQQARKEGMDKIRKGEISKDDKKP